MIIIYSIADDVKFIIEIFLCIITNNLQ